MRRLSVFAGGWTFEAADAICSKHDVMNLLTQLVNKSLVIFDDEGSEPRYHMLETVRQYPRDKLLEMGESEEARNAHLDFFFQLTELAAPEVQRLQDLEWITRLETEHDNLRAALEWGLEKNIEVVLRMIWNLYLFWTLRGLEAEGREWATAVIAKANSLPKLEGEEGRKQMILHGYALEALANIMYSQGDNHHAIKISEQGAKVARELGDKRLLALTLSWELSGKLFVGDTTDTETMMEECLTAARMGDDQFALGLALTMAGQRTILTRGDSAIGHKLIEEGVATAQASGNRWGYTMSLLTLGMMAKFKGDYVEGASAICGLRAVVP